MANAWQHNACVGQAFIGQQALPKQQTIAFVPAMLKHLAPQKAEKSGLGKDSQGQLTQWVFMLEGPPQGFPVVVRTPGW